MPEAQVTIIGGGLAGPVLALALHKHGISSSIYELRPSTYSSGGNIALAPNAARVLDHIGVYGRLRTRGFNYEEISFENGSGTVLGKFLNGSQKQYNFHALRIKRSIVHDELLSACKQRGIPVHYGKKFKSIIAETDQDVTVLFEDGEKVTSGFVVGCDGIHSKVRSHIEVVEPEFSGLMGIMGSVMETDFTSMHGELRPSLPCMMFGASGSFAIMPSSFDGKEVGYFATLETKDRSREDWSKLDQNKSELHQMLAERFSTHNSHWPDIVRELGNKTPEDTLTSWPFFSVPTLHKWTSTTGRVVIIGDAAHAIPPTGGQGAAMAFEDAETLAYVLERIQDMHLTSLDGDHKSIADSILGKWQQHRHDRIVKVMDFTSKNGTLRKSSPHFYEQAAKEWIIWAAFKFMGAEAGAKWLYTYNAEDILGVVA
ncbi:salicylate hydroxylase [Fusarium beomiforme]|uniref:Salicylate hydroxylase n=1 Tax=Fusarium beomiforme TaxID=44412 RepID=A0A9P5E7J7_9HYPO|nr:salicylate hydroxylase [Fusarium beomiforme]